jgi:NAD-dependent deacetylase
MSIKILQNSNYEKYNRPIMSEDLSIQLNSILHIFEPESKIVILTGAGMSEESGIPTFRGKDGLWTRYDPAVFATAEAVRLRLDKVWKMHDELRQLVASKRPNPGHYAIAEFEEYFNNLTIITQNVDNYHQDAGSSNVLEVHGNAWRVKCVVEDKSWTDKTQHFDVLPPKCNCGSPLRPDVVFFDEPLDKDVIDSAFTAANAADIIMVIGTSCVVYPAAYIPVLGKQSGAKLIEINQEFTPITSLADASIMGKSGKILPDLLKLLKERME